MQGVVQLILLYRFTLCVALYLQVSICWVCSRNNEQKEGGCSVGHGCTPSNLIFFITNIPIPLISTLFTHPLFLNYSNSTHRLPALHFPPFSPPHFPAMWRGGSSGFPEEGGMDPHQWSVEKSRRLDNTDPARSRSVTGESIGGEKGRDIERWQEGRGRPRFSALLTPFLTHKACPLSPILFYVQALLETVPGPSSPQR